MSYSSIVHISITSLLCLFATLSQLKLSVKDSLYIVRVIDLYLYVQIINKYYEAGNFTLDVCYYFIINNEINDINNLYCEFIRVYNKVVLSNGFRYRLKHRYLVDFFLIIMYRISSLIIFTYIEEEIEFLFTYKVKYFVLYVFLSVINGKDRYVESKILKSLTHVFIPNMYFLIKIIDSINSGVILISLPLHILIMCNIVSTIDVILILYSSLIEGSSIY